MYNQGIFFAFLKKGDIIKKMKEQNE